VNEEITYANLLSELFDNINKIDTISKANFKAKIIKSSNKNNKLKILEYNLFYGADLNQLSTLIDSNTDILFLSESDENLDELLTNYISYKTLSHCKYTFLLINKKLDIQILRINKLIGIIIINANINNIEFILVSMHLKPFRENKKIREEQISKIMKIIIEWNKLNIPIIMAGDTNMRDDENDIIKKYNLSDPFIDEIDKYNLSNPFMDEYDLIDQIKKYTTYPNRQFVDDRIKFTPNNNFRFDRIFIKNCSYLEYKILPNTSSDHLALEALILF
jgi:hypothetical protein